MAFNLTKIIGAVSAKTTSEIVVYSKNNPLAPRAAADYEPRTVGPVSYTFPHMWAPATGSGYTRKEYLNIFDQTFTLISTLDVPCEISLRPTDLAQGQSEIDSSAAIYQVVLGTMAAAPSGGVSRFVLTPEKASDDYTIDMATVVSVPELRQPFPGFIIRVTPTTVPTTGEIKILNARRY